jgi:hypothetical protein
MISLFEGEKTLGKGKLSKIRFSHTKIECKALYETPYGYTLYINHSLFSMRTKLLIEKELEN